MVLELVNSQERWGFQFSKYRDDYLFPILDKVIDHHAEYIHSTNICSIDSITYFGRINSLPNGWPNGCVVLLVFSETSLDCSFQPIPTIMVNFITPFMLSGNCHETTSESFTGKAL